MLYIVLIIQEFIFRRTKHSVINSTLIDAPIEYFIYFYASNIVYKFLLCEYSTLLNTYNCYKYLVNVEEVRKIIKILFLFVLKYFLLTLSKITLKIAKKTL